MERIKRTRGWWLGVLVAVVALGTVAFSGGNGNNDGPDFSSGTGGVWLAISLNPEFDTTVDDCDCKSCSWRSWKKNHKCGQDKDAGCCCSSQGSAIVLVRIGTYYPGVYIGDTRFLLADSIGLPDDFSMGSHDDNQVTIFGSFDTDSASTIHMVTPEEDATIPRRVQEAFYYGSPALDTLPLETTTADAAVAVANAANENAPPGHFDEVLDPPDGPTGPVLPEELLPYMFETQETLECNSPCQSEGEMFAHDPSAQRISKYELMIDEDNSVHVDLCSVVKVDIQKSVLNINSNEAIWVTIFGKAGSDGNGDAFSNLDVDDIDRDTVTLSGVSAEESSIQDKDNDGHDDLLVKFMLGDLQSAGVITSAGTTYTLEIRATDTDGACLEGSDTVYVDEEKSTNSGS